MTTSSNKNKPIKVNKAAIIARLKKTYNAKRKVLEMGVLPVSPREIEAEARELARNRADAFINTSED
jgi:hypothetical protein